MQLAQDEDQLKQFEWNARTQIPMWFRDLEDKASLLCDYGKSRPGKRVVQAGCG